MNKVTKQLAADFEITGVVTHGDTFGIDYHVTADVTFYRENDYGADADGNRGIQRVFLDDIANVKIYDDDGLVTEEDMTDALYDQAIIAIEDAAFDEADFVDFDERPDRFDDEED